MIRIGIVGDIGSGKSFVAYKFGYPVFNADQEVSKLYKFDKRCFKKLNKVLPKHILSFPITKKQIISAIIENNLNLKKIIKIIHPLIRIKMKNFLHKNKNKKIDRGSESPSFTCSKKVIKENAYPSNSFVVKNNVVRTIEYLKPTK